MTQSPSPSKESEPPLRVAIVAWQALPAVFPAMGRNIGGLETAAWLLARGLAAFESLDCSFVVRADQAVESSIVDSVELVVDVDPREPIRREVSKVFEDGLGSVFRRIRPRSFWQIPYLAMTWPMRRPDPVPCEPDPRLISIEPDVWIAMGVSRESAGVIATAHAQGRPSVLMIQSNADLDSRYATDPEFRNRYGERSRDCLFAIRHADRVVCQTNDQLQLLRESFERNGILVRNAIDLDRWSQSSANDGDHVLWVGRYDDFHKRPHLAMDIAAKCPEIPFRMIINPSDADVQRRLIDRCPSNVTIHQYVPSNAMPETIARCRVFLSTGAAEYEGFPNVLLQATATGKPIVSLDDFDHYLDRSGAGVHTAGDLEAAAVAIREIYSGKRVLDGEQAHHYLQQHHALGTIVATLAASFTDLRRRQ